MVLYISERASTRHGQQIQTLDGLLKQYLHAVLIGVAGNNQLVLNIEQSSGAAVLCCATVFHQIVTFTSSVQCGSY